jgi:hypothetical protein
MQSHATRLVDDTGSFTVLERLKIRFPPEGDLHVALGSVEVPASRKHYTEAQTKSGTQYSN